MSGVFGLLLAGVNGYVLNKNNDKGVMLYVILSLVAPVFYFSSVAIQYNWIFLPVLCIWWYSKERIKLNRINVVTFLLMMIFILDCFSTFISYITGFSTSVLVIAFFGLVKYILIFDILHKQNVIKNRFGDILRIVLFINVIAIIIEYLLLQNYPAASVFEVLARLFATDGNSGSIKSVIEHLSEGNSATRLPGTFSSSALISIISVVGIGFFYTEYRVNRNIKSLISILMCLFCGLASASKRFFLGGLLIVMLSYVLGVYCNREIQIKRKKISIISVVCIIILIVSLMGLYLFFKNSGIAVDYYLKFLTEGRFLDSFSTRFGSDGAVNSMKPLIHQKWLLGVGEVAVDGVAFIDSMVYVTLAQQGIVGLGFYILIFIFLAVKTLKERSLYKALILSVVFFEFVIGTVLFSSLGILLLAFVATPSVEMERRSYAYKKHQYC